MGRLAFTVGVGCPPRTKKTSNDLVPIGPKCGNCGRARMVVQPSEAFRKWQADVKDQLEKFVEYSTLQGVPLPLGRPVACRAVFFRDRAQGDLVGYMQALADVLQACGVVKDDKWITSWDGTRLSKDAARPRVAVVLTWEDSL